MEGMSNVRRVCETRQNNHFGFSAECVCVCVCVFIVIMEMTAGGHSQEGDV